MEICGKREYDLLNKIGFVRMGGTAEELKAGQILIDEIKSMGITPAYEEFEVEDADFVKGELEILEPFNKKYTVTAYNLSESTSEDGITADFYYAENMTAADMANAKGKIILINGYMNAELFKKVLKSGAVGFITMSGTMIETEENSDLFTRTLRSTLRAYGNLPGANIRTTDAFDIVKNGATKAKLTVINKPVTRKSHNIIVTLEGTEHPEEIVCFGSHYDSVEFSTGVYDNGAGSVINMELLRHYLANPPKRTIKFLWYGCEEMGLLGSKAWVKAHEAELKDFILNVNIDVAGSVIGYDIARVIGTKAATAYTDAFMKRKGFPVEISQAIYSSDGVPFADKGVPSVNFIRFGHQIGGAFIHCRHDVIKYLSPESLEKTTNYIKEYCDEVINSAVFPIERVVPPEMVEKLDNYLAKNTEKDAEAFKASLK